MTVTYEGADPTGGILLTGPVAGAVRLSDGTVYDVTPPAITVTSGVHMGELLHHQHLMIDAIGGIPLPDGTKAAVPAHVCTEQCGAAATAKSE